MIDDEFEWDDDKAAANAEKHGVTFEQARSVFRDPFAIELLDDREDYSEDRYILIRHSPYTIQIRGNRTTFPPPRELYPLCSHPMA